MCDISKELQFGVIDFFYLLALNFPHCYGLSHTNAITYHSIEIVGNRPVCTIRIPYKHTNFHTRPEGG